MQCFGANNNDRLCDLCGRIDPDYRAACKAKRERFLEGCKRKAEIKSACPFKDHEWDHGERYDRCGKFHHFVPCRPDESCIGD
jgi:hypothetical protein